MSAPFWGTKRFRITTSPDSWERDCHHDSDSAVLMQVVNMAPRLLSRERFRFFIAHPPRP